MATSVTYAVHNASDGGSSDVLTARRETRVFAHAAAESQSTIVHDSFVQTSRPSTSTGGRPNTSSHSPAQDLGFLEVFPRVASRPPRLLSELEALLVDRLRSNDKVASLTPITGKERDAKLAANLLLDAHRQVFAAFALGFTTYSPILTGIQEEFELSLLEGLRCSLDNVHMRTRIQEEELRREKAALDVRTRVLAEELPLRQATSARLVELKERSERASRRAATAERELADLRYEEARLAASCAALRDANRKVAEVNAQDGQWARTATTAPALCVRVGPLTKEDEAFLELELGAAYTPNALAAKGAATTATAAAAAAAADGCLDAQDDGNDDDSSSSARHLEQLPSSNKIGRSRRESEASRAYQESEGSQF